MVIITALLLSSAIRKEQVNIVQEQIYNRRTNVTKQM